MPQSSMRLQIFILVFALLLILNFLKCVGFQISFDLWHSNKRFLFKTVQMNESGYSKQDLLFFVVAAMQMFFIGLKAINYRWRNHCLNQGIFPQRSVLLQSREPLKIKNKMKTSLLKILASFVLITAIYLSLGQIFKLF